VSLPPKLLVNCPFTFPKFGFLGPNLGTKKPWIKKGKLSSLGKSSGKNTPPIKPGKIMALNEKAQYLVPRLIVVATNTYQIKVPSLEFFHQDTYRWKDIWYNKATRGTRVNVYWRERGRWVNLIVMVRCIKKFDF